MPRPRRSERPEPIEEKILDAATDLFAHRGYEGVSLADIAAAVGVRPQSLAHHFGRKEALYEAVVQRFYARLLPAVVHLAPDTNVAVALPIAVAAIAGLPELDRRMITTIAIEILASGRGADIVSRAIGPILDALEERLREDADASAPVRETLGMIVLASLLSLPSGEAPPGLKRLREITFGDSPRMERVVALLFEGLERTSPRRPTS